MIQSEALSYYFGRLCALDKVSFQVQRGEILGLIGPNGAGKTTLMRIFGGVLQAREGSASINGFALSESPTLAKQVLGYLPEGNPLYMELKVAEALRFTGLLWGLSGAALRRSMDKTAEICGLKEVWKVPVDELSKGYRQRVGLAQTVLHDPLALILDEPTDGLDFQQKRVLQEAITHMAETKAILISTHLIQEIQALCKGAVVLQKGRICAHASLAELKASHASSSRVRLLLNEDAESLKLVAQKLRKIKAIASITQIQGGFELTTQSSSLLETLWKLSVQEGWKVLELKQLPAELQAVFEGLITKNNNNAPHEKL